jgi:hypothetical protein
LKRTETHCINCKVEFDKSNYRGKGLCHFCYNKQYWRIDKKIKPCLKCGELRQQLKDGYCRECSRIEIFDYIHHVKMCDVIDGEIVMLGKSDLRQEALEMSLSIVYPVEPYNDRYDCEVRRRG